MRLAEQTVVCVLVHRPCAWLTTLSLRPGMPHSDAPTKRAAQLHFRLSNTGPPLQLANPPVCLLPLKDRSKGGGQLFRGGTLYRSWQYRQRQASSAVRCTAPGNLVSGRPCRQRPFTR
eukprot:366279-Chlamydomonas_euryale.AAC.2